MTRIVCFADTHGHHEDLVVPDGDILIFAGDLMGSIYDERAQLFAFNQWLCSFPHQHKVVVAGNHDRIFENKTACAAKMITEATYLEDSGTTCCGLTIWGSPYTLRFLDWAFNEDRGEQIRRHWRLIPSNVNILVTHGPPQGILDKVHGKNLGCQDLQESFGRLRDLKLHVFGHIHEGRGKYQHNGVVYANCSKGYHPENNPPIVVNL